MATAMELQYIRTDKNGTRYYHDWNCRRCGGAGESDRWIFTGRTCFDCGGSGRRNKPAVVKEYTDEYRAKLDAKRIATRKAKMEKEKADGYLPALKKLGFGENGVGYVYTGDTYKIKDELRRGGAKFSYALHWVSPQPIADFPCVEAHAEDLVEWFDGGCSYDLHNQKCEAWREAHGINW